MAIHTNIRDKSTKTNTDRSKTAGVEIPELFRVVIHVSNLEEAATFYSTLLNLEGKRISAGRHYFQCGHVILALYDAVKEAHFHKGPIPEHIYFAVDDIEAVHERAEKLNCLSMEMIQDEKAGDIVLRPWSERSFYAHDPYNNGLCFVERNTINPHD